MEIIVTNKFEDKFNDSLDYALEHFGRKTVRRWKESLQKILSRLAVCPEMFPFVPELKDIQPNAHYAIIMKSFRVIFIYDSQNEVVKLVDLWSMRQNPRSLRMSWKFTE